MHEQTRGRQALLLATGKFIGACCTLVCQTNQFQGMQRELQVSLGGLKDAAQGFQKRHSSQRAAERVLQRRQ